MFFVTHGWYWFPGGGGGVTVWDSAGPWLVMISWWGWSLLGTLLTHGADLLHQLHLGGAHLRDIWQWAILAALQWVGIVP